MTEITIKGHAYRIRRLDAFSQLHVSRKLAPLVPTLVPAFLKVARQGNMLEDVEGTANLLQPFANALADMRREDAEMVFSECLSATQRQTAPNTWAPVWSGSASACMFDDMDLGTMIQLVLEVVKDSLGPFIRGFLTSQPEANPTQGTAAG